jgi:dephospho-CoA kinase
LVLGVVGGVASGKSRVARLLAGPDGVHVDADALAHAALETPAVHAWVAEHVGAHALSACGVDRTAVARAVFADPALRRELEALIHPLVRSAIAEALECARREARARVVLDVPLLLENDAQHGLVAQCDALVFVDTDARVRRARARATRGWTDEELARREAAQMPLEFKRSRADVVISNDGDWAQTASDAQAALRRIEFASEHEPEQRRERRRTGH